jgi:hypothetical protein
MSTNRGIGCLTIAAVAFLAVWIGARLDRRTEAPAPTSSDFGNASSHALFAATIRKAGFDCPAANSVLARGKSAYGLSFEIWCGPAGTQLDNPALRYAVFPESHRIIRCPRDPNAACF